MADVFPAVFSDPVIFPRSFIYQSQTKPVFVPIAAIAVPATITSRVVFPRSIIYQVIAQTPFQPPPEVITEDKWHQPWSEPKRFKRAVAQQQNLVWSGFTPPPEVITVDKWFEWLSEPKRFKRGLKADEQQFIAYPPPFPNFIRTIGWFESLSEPKRFKKGLGAWLQQFFTTDQNKPVANPVFFSLNAVEINLDTALFGIAVGEEPVPVGAASASVTVVEIPAISGASASIQET